MVGTVTIQWCPNCKVWTKSTRVDKKALAARDGADLAGSVFHHGRHECQSCNCRFSTRQLKDPASGHGWTLAATTGKGLPEFRPAPEPEARFHTA